MADLEAAVSKSPIIMKVDSPPDDNKQDNEKNEANEELHHKVCKPEGLKPVLTASKFGYSNPFSTNSQKFPTKSPLRPSQLITNNLSNSTSSSSPSKATSFTLNPSKLNPFTKTQAVEDNTNIKHCDTDDKSKKQPEVNGELKFVPLLHDSSDASNHPTTSTAKPSVVETNNFIFGKNISERVVSDASCQGSKDSSKHSEENGTSDMLFTSALKETAPADNSIRKETKSLSESAREYEESRTIKRKYEEVEVKTGEEGETNVLQMSCKLFAYDKNAGGSWQERGRGTIRLNDQEQKDGQMQSRLVFRSSGNFRVILNTKIWADMSIELASNKSIRLTAFDSSGDVKVFLIMGSVEEIRLLYRHLEERLKREIATQEKSESSSDTTSPKRVATNVHLSN